jgi:WS/DGAT/MGAT family acyltransferase
MVAAGIGGAPPSPLNTRIGPHRRFDWVESDLGRFKAIKGALGGTVNDVVLAVVSGALREHLLRRGRDPEGIELKAMVPVSIRAEAERGALGNKVAAIYAPLPVGIADPLERFKTIHESLSHLKQSGQAVGAERITQLAGFAVPTVLNQAARLQSRQRFFNLTVTNVPGPRRELFLLGARMLELHPMVLIGNDITVNIAVESYVDNLSIGLAADADMNPDLPVLRDGIRRSLDELLDAASGA